MAQRQGFRGLFEPSGVNQSKEPKIACRSACKNKRREDTDEQKAPAAPDFSAEEQATNPYLKAAILEVVENQLRENNPPEIRQTLKRLLAAGHTRQAAVELIGSAVVGEIWQVLYERQPFDHARYKASLDKLN